MRLSKAILGIVAGVLLCQVGPAMAGPAKNGKAVAYAKASFVDGTIRSFGGAKTASASGGVNIVGDIDVIFTGKYPADITIDQVIIQATCAFGNFCVANAYATNATPTTITVHVGGFNSQDGSGSSNDVFVTVNIGQ